MLKVNGVADQDNHKENIATPHEKHAVSFIYLTDFEEIEVVEVDISTFYTPFKIGGMNFNAKVIA
ncbi:MAG: hypothetical protein K8R11_07225 [Methanococcoides sp.]|nr:hypothetical protein [Methanococcoides sp.]